MLEEISGYAIGLLIFCPFNSIIHELGHVFFVKLFGGKITSIEIGYGNVWFRFWKWKIRQYFFMYGSMTFKEDSLTINNRAARLLIDAGGILANIGMLILVISLFNHYAPGSFIKGYYIGFTATLLISVLIPYSLPDGTDSDGKSLLKYLS